MNFMNKFYATRTALIRYQHIQSKLKPRLTHRPTDVKPVFRRAFDHLEKIGLKDDAGTYSFGNLLMGANQLSREMTAKIGKTGERVVFVCPNDASYVMTQWACWISGQIAVPLNKSYPENLLEYYCNDSKTKLIVTNSSSAEIMDRLAKKCNAKIIVLDDDFRKNAQTKVPTKLTDVETGLSADFYNTSGAMILYTSGTTGNPKGVVLTHRNIYSQVNTLIDAWRWSSNDTVLHTLPLHHVHGVVNILLCSLYAGAKCVILPKFDANTVWTHLLGINENPGDRKITVFMAVPTIYSKLLEEYDRIFAGDPKMTEHIKTILQTKVRLMVSGSAPLPVPLYQRWHSVTGHRLLERYGMTEIGMCLSQLYDSSREPGYIGVPLPGVTIKIVDISRPNNETLLECTNVNGSVEYTYLPIKEKNDDPTGELHVKGEGVFKEYFRRPEETQKEFTSDGWFKTGDICQFSRQKKIFRILGRASVDIIKTGGYKVSAVDVETILLGHPEVVECAVLGIPDDVYGEKVAAIITIKPMSLLTHISLTEWAKEKMPKHWIPKEIRIVTSLPKNAMGKVNKKQLRLSVFPELEN
ncbi:acyl-CoA synthetase family member 3, mitochondrial [Agrilus planipennis]|uniref:Acyl-CoA synthetase family member 3, mitochondrial n=1 Tax=Agrilus planipennis TaxID=224129 RepID=A0A7F5RFD6_AGRPL|nr:acyl-CoA synthetase family member 3, mitochondrial [Agrilus planipennis]